MINKRTSCYPDQRSGNHEEESYSKSTLGTTHHMDDSERKILRVRWSYSNDCLVFDLSALAFHASKLDPTKRGIVGVASIEFMTL